MNNPIPNDIRSNQIGIFSTVKYVIYTICGSIVKMLHVTDKSLDICDDLVSTGQVHSQTLLKETQIESKDHLTKLNAQLENSTKQLENS